MKKTGMILLLILLVGFAAGCISSSAPTSTPSTSSPSTTTSTSSAPEYVVVNGTKIYLNEIHFYMYGMKTCPHCRKMKKQIPEVYGEDSLTYYELVDNPENEKLFQKIYELTGIQGVPAIAITYNGSISAIIEGEFSVNATPQIIQSAMANNGTFLVVGGKVYLLPHDSEDAMQTLEALYAIFVKHEMPPENSTNG
ncbi:glutaredoxin [Thermococcus siculi]|uniref:Glutaredoxin n=1 Tax=Thermococcus siculi TaxID=72803 RepID=A0A2Z2MQR4_9EURY|nr:thioredoxin fold domain-containing protein [Thermococcus siculi]ASJ08997.1 glutaredoxin [Thermococcus siculi]